MKPPASLFTLAVAAGAVCMAVYDLLGRYPPFGFLLGFALTFVVVAFVRSARLVAEWMQAQKSLHALLLEAALHTAEQGRSKADERSPNDSLVRERSPQ